MEAESCDTSDAQIIANFEKLEMSRDAAIIYCHLLKIAPVDVETLSSFAFGKCLEMNESLTDLAIRRLIYIEGNRVWVLNPRKSFSALAKELAWANGSAITTNSITKENVNDDKFSAAQDACVLLINEAGSKYLQRSPIDHSRLKVAKNVMGLSTLLSEAIDQAKSRICAISTSPRLPFLAVFWTSLTERLKAGINYQRIADLEEIEEHGYNIVKRDIEELGINLFVNNPSSITDKFYLVDDEIILFFDPTEKGFGLTGQLLKNKLITGKFQKLFDETLKSSIPVKNVLPEMEERINSVMTGAKENLNIDGVKWIEELCYNGVFSSTAKEAEDLIPEQVDKALALGLVEKRRQYEDREFYIPKYGWTISSLSRY